MSEARKKAPWHPEPVDPVIAAALQALEAGTADADQQKRALAWIIYKASGLNEYTYVPDSDQTVYLEGRRSVALQIAKHLIIIPRAFVRPDG